MDPDNTANSPTRERFIRAAQTQWVSRLIDTSRRNNLLYYRTLQTGTLELTLSEDMRESVLAGQTILLSDLAPETRNVRSSSVTAIMRKALENNEERGLKTLYVALGKLTWTSDDGGRPPEAPILLVPIEFKGKGQDAKTLSVQLAGRAEVNPVLLFVLKKQFDIEIPMDRVREPLKNAEL